MSSRRSRHRARSLPRGPVPSSAGASEVVTGALVDDVAGPVDLDALEQRLRVLGSDLVALDRRRGELLLERDQVARALAQGGRSWVHLARLAGTSRQALMKRAEP